MRAILYLSLPILLFLSLAACKDADPAGFESIFDGASFTGWEGNLEYFKITEGAIVAGKPDQDIPQNEFLCTEKEYGDFELRLQAKLTGKGKNAGVQFRSERIPDHHEVIGYQCDIGSMETRPIWASLYDESRRRVFLLHPPESAITKFLNPDDWNDIRIRCEGPDIHFWLNGYHVLAYTETVDSISLSGNICLQIHSGPPAEASYREIRIKE